VTEAPRDQASEERRRNESGEEPERPRAELLDSGHPLEPESVGDDAGEGGAQRETRLLLGTWLRHKVAAHILGRNNRQTAFSQRRFPTRFPFRGGSRPVPVAMAWYNFQDRMSTRE